jgi:hippurate hydrolase
MMQEWRQQLHAHAELAFQEHKTADDTSLRLESIGIEVSRWLAGTDVVGMRQLWQ